MNWNATKSKAAVLVPYLVAIVVGVFLFFRFGPVGAVGWPFAIVSAVVINVRLRRQNERIHVGPTPPKKPRKNDIWIDTQT